MLIHTGDARTVSFDLRLAAVLSLVAGAVNAAGFRSLGLFSGNMTGNVSALSDYLALGHWGLAGWAVSLVAAFVAGAFTSALLIEIGQNRRVHGIYAYAILAEAVLLALVGAADAALPPGPGDPLVLVGVAFAMGLQNAATTRISDSRVRTTHVTGIATDIGVELAILLGGARSQSGPAVVRHRLALHGVTLAAFVIGGLGGVLAYGVAGAGLFVLAAAVLVAVALPEARKARAAGRDAGRDADQGAG
ncbi:YoaK family protein [Acidimangrovimonas sediminis]|uniref:YoaK family protein n=1 Tax=Acidimangrovimonas sediminis TaxID=2056283 RepID=UPI000C80D55C|nr:YoaK family protein [Acidimangrovimonas sediminis]